MKLSFGVCVRLEIIGGAAPVLAFPDFTPRQISVLFK